MRQFQLSCYLALEIQSVEKLTGGWTDRRKRGYKKKKLNNRLYYHAFDP